MKLEEAINKVYNEAKKLVRVSCDEYHAHSAMKGCLAGDKNAITICKLCEAVNILLSKLDEVRDTTDGKWQWERLT